MQEWVGIVAGVGGGAGLVLSVTLSLLALVADRNAQGNCIDGICNDEGKSEQEAAKTLADSATAAGIVGGVLLGSGIALYLTGGDPGQPNASMAALVPILVPRGAGAAVRGRL